MRELWGSPGLWNQKKRHVEIARKLGVDEETVRNRIKFLKESGFLIGWRMVPNPALLGCVPEFLLLETKDRDGVKEETISKLKGEKGVITIISIYGDSLFLNLFDDARKEFSRRVSEISTIKTHPLDIPGVGFPKSSFRMTPTDWRIVSLMLKDAERRVTKVAQEIKVSEKTVKRRLNAMMDSSAILIMP